MPTLPPVFAASALYDTLLQGALRQFFEEATLETDAVPSESSDGRVAIEPTDDPAALVVRWFGFRHVLRSLRGRSFTPHEIRLARSVGVVLAARYRAILDPRLMTEREDLFRGHIEDRYVGAFLEGGEYRLGAKEGRADRIATAIEVLRVAALSRYENRPISSGVLLLDSERDPCRPEQPLPRAAVAYSSALTLTKRFYRLCDGERTVYLVNRDGLLFNIVDIARWAHEVRGDAELPVPCPQAYAAHARATLERRHACVVLSPSHEIKIFADGRQVFTFRNARWHLLDLEEKYGLWLRAVGDVGLARRVFQTVLELANARQGALFVILRDPDQAVPRLVAPADRLDQPMDGEPTPDPSLLRRELLGLLTSRSVTELDPTVLAALGRIDGATVTDHRGRLLAVGAILLHLQGEDPRSTTAEGARTTAALAACRYGPVLKVSEDGVITFFDRERIWDI